VGQVPKVFKAVAAAIEYGSIEGKTLQRVVETSKKLIATLSPAEQQQLWHNLSPDQQHAVSVKFQG
jgi:flagellar biosynthesis/type III secretory pathway chaperone